ncbi:MAG TPA: RNA methyltransferase [Bryobacteraceae bacterium]|nr:RNA methyltransferase [Bryobacteraceae bacterium]
MERVPYQVTRGAELYDSILALPVTVLLDDVRSLYNVGAFFRTCDAASIEKLLLCGITGHPPHKGITKTALGADATVPWEAADSMHSMAALRGNGYEVAVIETSPHAVDLFDWRPRFPVCVIFGNEVEGVRPELIALCDTHVRIPMLGLKHSLNVATAGGIVLYELLRKYRNLLRAADRDHARNSR